MKKKIMKAFISCMIIVGISGCKSANSNAGKSASDRGSTIVFGMAKSNAPYSYYKNGKLTGYDIEAARAIAKKMGYKAKFKVMNSALLTKALDQGEIDATGNQQVVEYLLNTKKDEKPPYWFTPEYKFLRLVVVARSSNTSIKHFDDMRNLKMAMTTGDFFEQSVLSDGGIIVPCKDFDECVDKVLNNQAAGTMNDLQTYQYYHNKYPGKKVKPVVISASLFPMTFMLSQENEDLSNKMTSAINSLQSNGTFTKISMKYFHQDISRKDR